MKRLFCRLFALLFVVLLASSCTAGTAACLAITNAAIVAASTAGEGEAVKAALGGVCSGSSPMGVTGPTDECSPVAGEDACQTCMRSMCCELAKGCGADRACWANVACDSLEAQGDGPASSCATTYNVDAPDDAYTSTIACVQKDCATECANLLKAAGQ